MNNQIKKFEDLEVWKEGRGFNYVHVSEKNINFEKLVKKNMELVDGNGALKVFSNIIANS